MRVGVLALQGDFAKHIELIRSLGVEAIAVRKAEDLIYCDGLIIPGGESTVISRQLDFINMREPLLTFAHQKPVFGTCAGLILMSKKIESSSLQSLQLLNITVERNAFGKQIESFQAFIPLNLAPNHTKVFPAFFIRAPRIRHCEEEIQVLATLEKEPVLVRQGNHLGATFHPELTKDAILHQYFIEMIRQQIRKKSTLR